MWDKFLMTTFLGGSGILITGYAAFWIRRLMNYANLDDKLIELKEEVEESNLYGRDMILERIDVITCIENKWYKVDEYIDLKAFVKESQRRHVLFVRNLQQNQDCKNQKHKKLIKDETVGLLLSIVIVAILTGIWVVISAMLKVVF